MNKNSLNNLTCFSAHKNMKKIVKIKNADIGMT